MAKLAFLFPGQGSQYPGMGQDLHQSFDFAREIFRMTDDAAGAEIRRMAFEGPAEALTRTVHQQPAVTAVNLCCLEYLRREGIEADFACGHSLGEFAALCAAGALGLEDTVRLVAERARLMDREAGRRPGAMSAVIGLSPAGVEAIVSGLVGRFLVGVANINSGEQLVISGEAEGVDVAGRQAAEQGAKVVPLPVSGAWHSELMRGAVEDFGRAVAAADVRPPRGTVIFNLTAAAESDPEAIRGLMVRQLVSPVRWLESMERLIAEGVTTFVEVGPKNVLKGLLRRIHPDRKAARMENVEDLKGLEAFAAQHRAAGSRPN